MSPSKALEHILGGSSSVPVHRSRLQAAAVSGGGSHELRIALVRNFSDSTDAVDSMLRAQVHAEAEGLSQSVTSPWCFKFQLELAEPCSIFDTGTVAFGSLSSATALALLLMPVSVLFY